ncbi:MAG: hypothetical protein LC116_09075 [Bacteroidetes bacterium]|nr:hypothetical protein [Bacteroidota bacterium]MCZ2133309.1 hypothetical protein [Bacteroidota bacterium]
MLLFYENGFFRAAHACWDSNNIEFLEKELNDYKLTDEFLRRSSKKGTALYNAVDETLKGKEIRLPDNIHFNDKDGNIRKKIRFETLDYYKESDKKVFFGHYWLSGKPSAIRDNIGCLDYSVAYFTVKN